MKRFIRLLTFVLAIVMVLGLAACGDSDKDTSSTNKPSGSDISLPGGGTDIDINSTITPPSLDINGFDEKKSIFVQEQNGQSMKIEVIHKDNQMLAFTLTVVFFFEDGAEEQMNSLKQNFDQQFAEAAKRDNISYSCVLSDKKASVVIAIRDLDVKENREFAVEMDLYDGYTVDDTYEDLEEYALSNGFTKTEG